MKRNSLYLIATILYLLSFSNLLSAQIITTVAGTGALGYYGDGGPATLAKFSNGIGVNVDSLGNIYIQDQGNHVVRMVNTHDTIVTFAGNGFYGFSGDGGAATLAMLGGLGGIMADDVGNVYFGDDRFRIRKVDPIGIISTIAGTGTVGFFGDGGPAILAKFNGVQGMVVDNSGNLYVADEGNGRIRKISPATGGTITTFAGNGTVVFSGDGGPATAAELDQPIDLAIDPIGNIYIADNANNRIRKVDISGIITTVAGTGISGTAGDGTPATAAELSFPSSVAVDGCGNLYIADSGTHIRKVDASGIISTVAGNLTLGYGGDGGPATASILADAFVVKTDKKGNVFIADEGNRRIRKITTTNRPPYFTGGHTQSFTVCSDSTISVDSLLAVIDSDMQQGETWSVLAAPVHGTLAAGYTTISTGGKLVPSGLSYATSGGYTGSDSFKVVISDCADLHDTTSVYVTVKSCALATSHLPSRKERVTLYPNPNTGTFSISIASVTAGDAYVVITNVMGEKVKEFIRSIAIGDNIVAVQLDNPTGMYFCNVVTPEGNYVQKVFVSK